MLETMTTGFDSGFGAASQDCLCMELRTTYHLFRRSSTKFLLLFFLLFCDGGGDGSGGDYGEDGGGADDSIRWFYFCPGGVFVCCWFVL